MEIKYRCKISNDGRALIEEIIEKILNQEDNHSMRKKIEKEMDAVVAVRYTTKTPNGVVVLRFQKKNVDYHELVIPKLVDENEMKKKGLKSKYANESSVGPGHHIVWSLNLGTFFTVGGKGGADTEVFLR